MNCACGNHLGARNTSGRCAACSRAFYNSDPETIEKRRSGIRATMADPDFRQRRGEISRRTSRLPHVKAAKSRNGKLHGIRNLMDPESRKKAAQTRRQKTTWCPEEWRTTLRQMFSQGYSVVEARPLIEEAIAAQARREVRAREIAARDRHERDLASQY